MGKPDGDLSLSVKLPTSATMALGLPFASPTGYGLARGGWVTARFGGGHKPSLPMLKAWIEESYRAVAPKKLLAELPGTDGAGREAKARPPGRVRKTAKRPAPKA